MVAVSADIPAHVWPISGSFSYHARKDRWEWSDEVAAMHGYEPGAVDPTTELSVTLPMIAKSAIASSARTAAPIA